MRGIHLKNCGYSLYPNLRTKDYTIQFREKFLFDKGIYIKNNSIIEYVCVKIS